MRTASGGSSEPGVFGKKGEATQAFRPRRWRQIKRQGGVKSFNVGIGPMKRQGWYVDGF